MYDGTPAAEPPVLLLVLPFFLTFFFLAPFVPAAFFFAWGSGGELSSLKYLGNSSRAPPKDSSDKTSALDVDRSLRALSARVR
jgi:hypothetical protein